MQTKKLSKNKKLVHPVNEHELLSDILAHEENGDEVFSA